MSSKFDMAGMYDHMQRAARRNTMDLALLRLRFSTCILKRPQSSSLGRPPPREEKSLDKCMLRVCSHAETHVDKVPFTTVH